jgi:hypothetical protein
MEVRFALFIGLCHVLFFLVHAALHLVVVTVRCIDTCAASPARVGRGERCVEARLARSRASCARFARIVWTSTYSSYRMLRS